MQGAKALVHTAHPAWHTLDKGLDAQNQARAPFKNTVANITRIENLRVVRGYEITSRIMRCSLLQLSKGGL